MDGAVVDDGTTGLTSRAGTRGIIAAVLGFALAVYAFYWVVGIVDPHVYRVTFLMVAIVLTIVAHPSGSSKRHLAWDVLWIALTVGAFVWPLLDIEAFVNRAATPNTIDIVAGVVT